MAPPIPPKLVAGTVAAAITLTAGSAIASDTGSESEEPKLEDIVLVRDVTPPEWAASDLVTKADDPVASPFDSAESVDSPESVDSAESVDSPESVDSVDDPDSVDSP